MWSMIWLLVQSAIVLWLAGGWALGSLDDVRNSHRGLRLFAQYGFMAGSFSTVFFLAWIWS